MKFASSVIAFPHLNCEILLEKKKKIKMAKKPQSPFLFLVYLTAKTNKTKKRGGEAA